MQRELYSRSNNNNNSSDKTINNDDNYQEFIYNIPKFGSNNKIIS